jgi:hypothetical protein
LANQLAFHFQIGHAGDWYTDRMMIQALAERLGISVNDIFAQKKQIEREIEKARIFLKGSGKG